MNIERLNDLIRVMEGVRDAGRAFDIGAWAQLDAKPAREMTLCNTACCAAGWCGFDPKFIENGFAMRATVQFDNCDKPSQDINISTKAGWMEMLEACRDPDYDGDVMIAPYYAEQGGFGATEQYFDLTELQNSYLFDGAFYRGGASYERCTPDDVIDHVQRVLDGRWIDDPHVQRNLPDSDDPRDFEDFDNDSE